MNNPFPMPENIREFVEQTFLGGFTQSELMTRADCVRKWYFQYVLGLKRKGSFSWALLFGDAVHQMLEGYYKHNNGLVDVNEMTAWHSPPFRYPDDLRNDEGRVMYMPGQVEEEYYWSKLAEIYVKANVNYWKETDAKHQIESVERLAVVEYREFRLMGKIDMEYREIVNRCAGKSVWVMDHKTTYDINESLVLGWQFRFQFLFYAWMVWKITKAYPAGVVVNALKKPAERRSKKKNESVDAFLTRIKLNIQQDPAHYFRRDRLPFDRSILPRFEKYILDPLITQLTWLRDEFYLHDESTYQNGRSNAAADGTLLENLYSLLLSANTNHCWHYNRPCPFLDLCQNAFDDHAQEYIQRSVKHEELEGVGDTQEQEVAEV